MTRARKAALAVINAAAEPLSAAGVFDAMGSCCDQATVYRALHYLESSGYAESFVLHCNEHGTERYYIGSSAKHRHWFHCESCHRFIDLGACRMGDMVREMEAELNLSVHRHIMYLTGLCQNCQEYGPAEAGPGEDS